MCYGSTTVCDVLYLFHSDLRLSGICSLLNHPEFILTSMTVSAWFIVNYQGIHQTKIIFIYWPMFTYPVVVSLFSLSYERIYLLKYLLETLSSNLIILIAPRCNLHTLRYIGVPFLLKCMVLVNPEFRQVRLVQRSMDIFGQMLFYGKPSSLFYHIQKQLR